MVLQTRRLRQIPLVLSTPIFFMTLQRTHWFKHAELWKTHLPQAPINENTIHVKPK